MYPHAGTWIRRCPAFGGLSPPSSLAALSGGIIAQDGQKVIGFTKHGIDRAIGDAGKRAGAKPEAILDALKNPKSVKESIDSQGRPGKAYKGEDAKVVVNPEAGKIISTNPLGRAGANSN